MKTLLVEDNTGDVNLIRVALTSFPGPVELFVADDGVKAMEFLRREGQNARVPRPDFVIVDLKLPRKSGLEVLSEMKRDPDLRRIPVIVLTSSKAPGDVARSYDLQAAAYFVKPVTGFDEVVDAILRFMTTAVLPADGQTGAAGAGPVAGRPTAVYPVLPTSEGSFGEWPLERRLTAIVESSADPIISVTLEGAIATWNRAAEDLYGYTEQEVRGKSIRLIVPKEAVRELESVLSAVRRGQRASRLDTARVDRQGRTISVSLSASPIYDRNGNIVGVSLNARDVTERKAIEEKFRVAVESSPNAVVMVDATGAILLVNKETERLFGYRRGEIVGKSIEILVPQRFRGQHPDLRSGFLAKPEARPMGAGRDLFGLRKDGSEVPIEIGLTPIQTPQGTLVLSAIVDITERKRNEEILAQQTRELARSNAELEQFAYVASHDLQEPLRTVASYTQLLDRRYGDSLEPEARTYIGFARQGAMRMQCLIEALLTYSRVGTQPREIGPADAGTAVDAALANLKRSIDEAGAEIRRGPLPIIQADPTQLAELFQNLIGNAIKFRLEDPPRVEIAARRAGSEWVFSVADNGIGIDPAYFDRIFQVFQRLHGLDAYPGTGIGLAVSKRIVDRLGGRIWVESAPGKGSTFHFSVPDVPAATQPQTSPPT